MSEQRYWFDEDTTDKENPSFLIYDNDDNDWLTKVDAMWKLNKQDEGIKHFMKVIAILKAEIRQKDLVIEKYENEMKKMFEIKWTNEDCENVLYGVLEYVGNEKYLVKIDELIGACKSYCYQTLRDGNSDNIDDFEEESSLLLYECIEYIRHNDYTVEFDDWDRALQIVNERKSQT